MSRQVRSLWMSFLVVASIGLVAASVAWACSSPDYGTPGAPPAPPAPTPPATAVTTAPAATGVAATAPAATAAPAAPSPTAVAAVPTASSSAPPTVSASTSGKTSARRPASGSTSGQTPSRTTSPTTGSGQRSSSERGTSGAGAHPRSRAVHGVAPSHTPPPGSPAPSSPASPYGAGALSTRDNGGTAGVTNANGQSVFTSSVAPPAPARKSHHAGRAHAAQRTRATHHARAAHPARAAAPAPTPSARVATGDVWSGFAGPAKSPVSAASAYSAGQGGGGSQVFAGIAILGLGLAGLFGGAFAMAVTRRRKLAAADTDRRR